MDVKPTNNCPLYSKTCEVTLEGIGRGWREMMRVRGLKRSGLRSSFLRLSRMNESCLSSPAKASASCIYESPYVSNLQSPVVVDAAKHDSASAVNASQIPQQGLDFGAMLNAAKYIYLNRESSFKFCPENEKENSEGAVGGGKGC